MQPLIGASSLVLLLFSSASSARSPESADPPSRVPPPSQQIVDSLRPERLQALAHEVLQRNPDLARARHAASAAAAEARAAGALPDPTAGISWFALTPETRVGPQEWGVNLSQALPWAGKLATRERMALWRAAAEEARLEALRLDLVTEARSRFYELAYLDAEQETLERERRTLIRLEEAARARYAAGMGLQQEILRIQAQITRIDERLLLLRERQIHLQTEVNTLRDRPPETFVGDLELPTPVMPAFLPRRLLDQAVTWRPELIAAEAEIERAEEELELSRLAFKPDFGVSLGYVSVGRREDEAGVSNPPEGNGDDILSLSGSVRIPLWRNKLDAGREAALERRSAAEQARSALRTEIESEVGDLTTRIPLLFEHWELLENVLRLQAEEALRSAEAAYTTGKLNAVDLLDAEVVLYEVQTSAARTAADLAIGLAELERAVARPLSALHGDSSDD